MMTVIVTGGIGSGKSEFCRFLAQKGIPVFDSDSRTHALYSTHPEIVDDLEEALGCSLRTHDGSLDRKLLSSIIFSDAAKLSAVESIVHPAVLDDFRVWKAFVDGDVPFVVFESAIVLEKPAFKEIADYVVLVDATPEVRLKRACARDGASEEDIIRRMSAQRFDLSRVDRIVRNDTDLDNLSREADNLFVYLQHSNRLG